MAISGGDGSIILTTKVDESGLKKGMQQANKFAQMSTNEQRRMAQSLSMVYRQQGMSQSEAQKKAWQDLKNNTVATKDLAKATEDVAKKTEQATKETKEYGETAKRSGTIAKNTFLAVGKAFLTIGVASAAAIVAMTKQAVSAYADYEQMVGGIETLWGKSAKKIVDYANDAFYTAGVSANNYMKQVTQFSAALIRSTAGDTEKAADIANMAMIDISDNVAKMGTNIEYVQLAYQGFARQQYILLDNLRLGYGGTKQEMERLLRDAEALTGVKYDIKNLSDVYTAIHVIQEELGIAEATAMEAERTISGSAKMMKAAWQNVLSAVAGGGDLDRAINNLVYSIQKYFENIVPVVERSLVGIGQLIEKVGPLLVKNVASALIKSIPSLINAIYQMIIGLAKGIWEGIQALFTGGSKTIEAQLTATVTGATGATEDASSAMKDLGDETEKAGKKAKKSFAIFDDLSIITSGATDSGESGISAPIGGVGGANVGVSGITDIGAGGGATTALQEQFAKLAEMAKSIWDSTPVQAFVTASTTILSTFGAFLTTMWSNIKMNASTTWDSIKGNLSLSVSNMTELWTTFWADVNAAVETWGEPIIASISELFNSIWETAIDPAVQFIVQAWTDFTGVLLELWQEHGAPLLQNVGEYVNNIIGLFQSVYDNIIAPIIEPFLEELSQLWDNHIKGMLKSVGDFIMTLANGALEIYNKFISPIVKFLLEFLAPAFATIGATVSGIWGAIVGTIADAVKGIMDILSGLINFVVGVFTGNWEKAMGGISQAFEGVVKIIEGVFKGFANLIIAVINGLISGINKAIGTINKIPGVNIKKLDKIPKLAQGTVVPPNKEFMAVLGDNKTEHEVVSPISTMKQAFKEAMVELGGGYSGNTEVILQIDGREFGRAVVEQGNKENRRIGTRLVIA